MMAADCAASILAAVATKKIGARFATNMAMTCCRPNGMPFQNDTGASRLLNASKDTPFFMSFAFVFFSVFSVFFSSLNCYILSYNRLSVLKKSGAEFDGAVFRIHRFDDCQGIDVVPFLTQLVATALEALFHCDADAFHSGSGFMAQLDQAF